MFRANFLKLAFNSAVVFGVWFLYTKITNMVVDTTIKLLKEPFVDKDAEEEEKRRIRRIEKEIRRIKEEEEIRRIKKEERRSEEEEEKSVGKTDKFCFKLLLFPYIKRTMSDNKLVKTVIEAATLTGLAADIGWAAKKVVKENFTSDPSSSPMNYVKFTAVMAGSIALKKYLEDQKILATSV